MQLSIANPYIAGDVTQTQHARSILSFEKSLALVRHGKKAIIP